MSRFLATLAAIGTMLFSSAGAAAAQGVSAAQGSLQRTLSAGVRSAGSASGAYVVDLSSGRTLFSAAAGVQRLPASVEKIYTTSAALLLFGPGANLTTSVLGTGMRGPTGTWNGTLYLRGGGDPTFGSSSFDQYAYGAGATIQRLTSNFIHGARITALHGSVVGDESYFDSLRGTPPTGFQFSPYLEGSLSALAFNRGLINQGSSYVLHPALFAASQLVSALHGAGVKMPHKTSISAGAAPAGATLLADVHSPRIATLVQLTNTPSDNFFAEMLLKAIGARFGTGGTTAAGAAVVRAQLGSSFGIHPRLDDGSGLSRYDRTSPRQVVTALERMSGTPAFTNSLAVAGDTGTLQGEMQGTFAQGRCRGKTGTLHDVSNLVGYCRARNGHTLAFAFLMNAIDPNYAHPIQDQMAVAVARYKG